MDCMDDPKFQLIALCLDDNTKNLLKNENDHWLDKCGHTFIRHAIMVNYNNHYYHEGCSWVGGRISPSKIPAGKCGRVFVNMRYVLMAIKTPVDFMYIAVRDNLEPTFDIFIEY